MNGSVWSRALEETNLAQNEHAPGIQTWRLRTQHRERLWNWSRVPFASVCHGPGASEVAMTCTGFELARSSDGGLSNYRQHGRRIPHRMTSSITMFPMSDSDSLSDSNMVGTVD